jgi:hypothetical protein
VDPLDIMSSSEETTDADEDDTEEADVLLRNNMPPLSTYGSAGRFWCWHVAFVPAAFVGANIIAFSSLLFFNVWEYRDHLLMRQMRSSSSTSFQPQQQGDLWFAMFQSNSMVTAVILLVDTVLLHRAVVYMERQMVLWDDHAAAAVVVQDDHHAEQEVNNHRHEHAHAQVSRKLDAFFSGNNHNNNVHNTRLRPTRAVTTTITTTTTTFFVSLLYVAVVLTGAGCLASWGVRLFANTATARDQCSSAARQLYANQQQTARARAEEPIPGLPEGLQGWAKGFLVHHGGRPQEVHGATTTAGSLADFLHLSDGRTFFAGHPTTRRPDQNNDNDEDADDTSNRILVVAQPDGSMVVHSDVFNPKYLTVISTTTSDTNHNNNNNNNGSSSETTTTTPTAFCGLYWKPYQPPTHHRSDIDQASRVFCITTTTTSADLSQEMIPNCTVAGDNRSVTEWTLELEAATAHESIFWYLARWIHHRRSALEYVTEFYQVDPATMMVQSVVNVTTPYNPYGNEHIIDDFGSPSRHGACMRWLAWITSSLVALVTVPGTYWLWKIKNVAAGLSPAVVAILYTANAFNNIGLASVVGWLILLATSFVFLGGPRPRWLNREAAVWAHYSAMACIMWLHASLDRGEYPYIALIALALAENVILDHPVLQVLGWVGGPVCALQAIRNGYRAGSIPYFIGKLSFAFFGGFGLVSAGHALRQYRVYINYYTKRIWHVLRSAVIDHPHQRIATASHNRVAVVAARNDTGADADLTNNFLD